MKRSKSFEKKAGDRRIDNYTAQLKTTFEKINDIYFYYKTLYDAIDNSSYYISNDIFSAIMSKSKLKEKVKFFKGL